MHDSELQNLADDADYTASQEHNIEIQELSGDDYFSKNNEFSTWLKEQKDVFFSDLSADAARKLFADFMKAWNKKKLDIRYYKWFGTAPRSAHNWKLKG